VASVGAEAGVTEAVSCVYWLVAVFVEVLDSQPTMAIARIERIRIFFII